MMRPSQSLRSLIRPLTRPVTSALRRACLGSALGLAAALVVLAAPVPAAAQNMFAPALNVNDRVITNFDITQRMRLLEVLNVGAEDMREEAIQRLTEEAVQAFHARRAGVRIAPDELAEGVAEFAARANMEAEEFIAELSRAGVDETAFRDFIEVGLMWRQMVRARFVPRVSITEAEIDRALSVSAIRGTQRVLMSEIFLPSDPEFAEAVGEIIPQILAITTFEDFADAARQVSIAGSREQGGRLEWLDINALPPEVRAQVRDARPGAIIGPIEVPGAFGIFQLRATDSRRDIPPDQVRVDYKTLLLPGGRSEANAARLAEIRARVDRCTDLNAFARDLFAEALVRSEELVRSLPQETALELSRLDEKEISANMVRGGNLVVLMLCSRTLEYDEPPTRNQVRNQLRDQRLNQLADNWLAELVAEAEIRRR